MTVNSLDRPKSSKLTHLERLRFKHQQLKDAISSEEKEIKALAKAAEKEALAEQAKVESRKQVVIGTAILSRVKAGVLPEQVLNEWPDEVVNHPKDRKLLGLTEWRVWEPLKPLALDMGMKKGFPRRC